MSSLEGHARHTMSIVHHYYEYMNPPRGGRGVVGCAACAVGLRHGGTHALVHGSREGRGADRVYMGYMGRNYRFRRIPLFADLHYLIANTIPYFG